MTRRSQRRAFYALRGRPAVFCRWRCFSARRSGRLPDHAFSRRFRSPSRRLPTPLFRARPDSSGSSGHIPRRVSSRCFFPPFYSAFCFSRSFFFFRGFLLSYSVSVLLAGGVPAARACLIVGLPALFSLTALFLLGEEAFCSSLDIYRTCRGYPTVRFSFVSADRLLIAALLVSAAAFVRQLLIPLLL